MFVSIDMDTLRFLHKHPDHETVSAISWLECGQQVSVRVDNTEREEFLGGVAHGDLCHLYRNVTGDDFHKGQWGERAHQFRERLREAARNMPVTNAVSAEVFAQVAKVNDRLYAGERFSYAKGAATPAQAQELFPLRAAPLAPSQTTAADQRAAELRREQLAREEAERNGDLLPRPRLEHEPEVEAAGSNTSQAEAQAPAAPTVTVRSKSVAGATRAVVNAAADSAWEQAGRPADPLTVKTIARDLHAGIAAQGHNPTTTRIKLTEWAKAKLASFQA